MQKLTDDHQECLQCRVPNGCSPSHPACGVKRGIKYGLYSPRSLEASSNGLPKGFFKKEKEQSSANIIE